MKKAQKSFEEQLYKKIEIENLALFSMDSLVSKKKKCTFLNLLKESFELFPLSFNFLKHPDWPDSRKLENALNRLRLKKLIKGDPKTVFSLTKSGQKEVSKLGKELKQRKLLL